MALLITPLRYLEYSSGLYGPGMHGGITLQFLQEDTGTQYYVIFNTDVKRKRNTESHKAGTLLPKGRFSVGEKSAFYKFWLSTGIAIPPRLSAFNDYMGKLKAFKYSAYVTKGTRLDAQSLKPILNPVDSSNNLPTNFKQHPNNPQTNVSNTESLEQHIDSGLNTDLAACKGNYDISKQGGTFTSKPLSHLEEIERVQNQTVEEWIAEYEAEIEKYF